MRMSRHFVTQHHKDSALPNVLYELFHEVDCPILTVNITLDSEHFIAS